MPGGPFVLDLPPAPAYVSTARLFVGSVARHFGADETAIEDAKVAVSEACASAMRSLDGSGEGVHISIEKQAEDLRFEVEADIDTGGGEASTTEDVIRSLGVELIRALFPGAETSQAPGARTTLSFAVPTGNTPN